MKAKTVKTKPAIAKQLKTSRQLNNDLNDYVAKENRVLEIELESVMRKMDAHRIESTFAFKNSRFEDRSNHNLNQLDWSALRMSGAIRRLEFLMQTILPSAYNGTPVGSTGTPQGDFHRVLELVANASYAIAVLQGAQLQGASDTRLEEIKLTTYYDFPREHWKHLRTSNVVDRLFHGCGSERQLPDGSNRRSMPPA